MELGTSPSAKPTNEAPAEKSSSPPDKGEHESEKTSTEEVESEGNEKKEEATKIQKGPGSSGRESLPREDQPKQQHEATGRSAKTATNAVSEYGETTAKGANKGSREERRVRSTCL